MGRRDGAKAPSGRPDTGQTGGAGSTSSRAGDACARGSGRAEAASDRTSQALRSCGGLADPASLTAGRAPGDFLAAGAAPRARSAPVARDAPGSATALRRGGDASDNDQPSVTCGWNTAARGRLAAPCARGWANKRGARFWIRVARGRLSAPSWTS